MRGRARERERDIYTHIHISKKNFTSFPTVLRLDSDNCTDNRYPNTYLHDVLFARLLVIEHLKCNVCLYSEEI